MSVLQITLFDALDRIGEFLSVSVGFHALLFGCRAASAGACEVPAGLEEVLARLGGGQLVGVVDEDFGVGGDGVGGGDLAELMGLEVEC